MKIICTGVTMAFMLKSINKSRRERPRRSTPTTLWSRAGRRDRGIGLMEALATIAILGALTAGAIIAVPRLLNRGQDSAASTSLNTAVTEAREIYSRVTSTGGTNFTGTTLEDTLVAAPATPATTPGCVTAYGTGWTYNATALNGSPGCVANRSAQTLTQAAVATLNNNETSLCYYPLTGNYTGRSGDCDDSFTTPLVNNAGAPATGVTNLNASNAIRAKGANGIWVFVSNGETWTGGTNAGSIRAGQVIRMGNSSESGATYCTILIADHTVLGQTGTGFEANSENTSNSTAAGNNNGWADCGAKLAGTARGAESAVGLSQTIPTPD